MGSTFLVERAVAGDVGVKSPVGRREVGVLLHGVTLAVGGSEAQGEVAAGYLRRLELRRHGSGHDQIDAGVAVIDRDTLGHVEGRKLKATAVAAGHDLKLGPDGRRITIGECHVECALRIETVTDRHLAELVGAAENDAQSCAVVHREATRAGNTERAERVAGSQHSAVRRNKAATQRAHACERAAIQVKWMTGIKGNGRGELQRARILIEGSTGEQKRSTGGLNRTPIIK